MNGWIKYFLDGQEERGDDSAVHSGQASWSRGRLAGMCGASVHHGRVYMTLQGHGDYWQSDDYDATVLSTEPPTLVARRIMKQILPGERVFQVFQTEHSTMLRVLDFRFGAGELLLDEQLEVIPQGQEGKWLVLEYDIKSNRVQWYYSEDRI